jgi:DNA replication protein DnaC
MKVSKEQADLYGDLLCDDCEKKYLKKKAESRIKKILPKKFWDIETDKSLDKYKDKLCSLFIHGKAGVGKTVLACSLAKLYIRQGYVVRFISYPAFIMDLQSRFRGEKDIYGYAKEIAWYPEDTNTSLRHLDPQPKGILIIDDFGAAKLTDFVQQITYYLINEREMKMLPTIITSNFDLNEIDEQIDPRVSSRISGMCEVLQIISKDRRK